MMETFNNSLVVVGFAVGLALLGLLAAASIAWDLKTNWQRKSPRSPSPTPVRKYIFSEHYLAECVNGKGWEICSLDISAECTYTTDTEDHARELMAEFDKYMNWKVSGPGAK